MCAHTIARSSAPHTSVPCKAGRSGAQDLVAHVGLARVEVEDKEKVALRKHTRRWHALDTPWSTFALYLARANGGVLSTFACSQALGTRVRVYSCAVCLCLANKRKITRQSHGPWQSSPGLRVPILRLAAHLCLCSQNTSRLRPSTNSYALIHAGMQQ